LIIRAFIALRQFALTYAEIGAKIAEMEKKYDKKFKDVYEVLNLLVSDKNGTGAFAGYTDYREA